MKNKKLFYITSLIMVLNAQLEFLSLEKELKNRDIGLNTENPIEFIEGVNIMNTSSTSSINIRLFPHFC